MFQQDGIALSQQNLTLLHWHSKLEAGTMLRQGYPKVLLSTTESPSTLC